MVSANHSSSYKGEYAGDPAGLIISFEDDICIYHMGDTNSFADLQLYGELYEPTLVFAPVEITLLWDQKKRRMLLK